MHDLWGVLYQSLIVCLSACFLLLIKRLFKDKLSAFWQYSVWGLLGARMLVPASVTGWLFLQVIPYGFECLKFSVETRLHSAYVSPYTVTQNRSVLPMIRAFPLSLTDWLFVIYTAGAVLFFLRLVWTGIRLAYVIRHGEKMSEAQKEAVDLAESKYHMHASDIRVIADIPSPFVFGIFRQTLVLPKDMVIDEKIILHELFHLKYHDALQNTLWQALLCLHWWNPFMHWVVSDIRNDLETLCDERVLEMLTPAERKEYGNLLLVYGKEKYTNMPLTSSIANGEKNIPWRIEAIVRFTKYPKNMRLVSFCMALLMAWPLFVQSHPVYGQSDYSGISENEKEYAMVKTRLNRCDSPEAAFDIYGKGLLLKNAYYLATVSALSEQETILNSIQKEPSGSYRFADAGPLMDDDYDAFEIFNLAENKDGTYDADLVFFRRILFPANEEKRNYTLIPVKAVWNDGWTVSESGERKQVCNTIPLVTISDFPYASAVFETEYGTMRIDCASRIYMSETEQTEFSVMDTQAKADHSVRYYAFCFETENTEDTFGLQLRALKNDSEYVQFPHRNMIPGSSGYDGMWNFACWRPEDNGRVFQISQMRENGKISPAPACFAVQLYRNNEIVYEGIVDVSQ